MKHPLFIIELTKQKTFVATLTDINGQVIFWTDQYSTKDGCKNGIESIKKNSQIDKKFVREESKNRKLSFVLRAANNKVIGYSKFYNTKDSMENGIEAVKTYAPLAEIDDRS